MFVTALFRMPFVWRRRTVVTSAAFSMCRDDYQNLVRFSGHPHERRPFTDMNGGDAVRPRRFALNQASSHQRRDWRIETRAVALPPYNKNVRCDVLPAPTDHAQELRPVESQQLDHNKKVQDLKL